MEKAVSVLVVLSLLADGLTLEIPQVQVFYVKPTVAPTTECPSGDSPCHSLQYYANHSSFTNNSRFLFLEGEHHLDSVVTISNVANLSLVGLSSGVDILCKSVPSGFYVEKFMGFNIEKMALTNCTGTGNAPLSLMNGSDVSLKGVTIKPSGGDADGLVATNVLGVFSIFNSTLPSFANILVDYTLCDTSSYFNLTKNILDAKLNIRIYCSDTQVLIDDSRLSDEVTIEYSVLTNNSIRVSNSRFCGGGMTIGITCYGSNCGNRNFRMMITKSIFNTTVANFWLSNALLADTTILVEDSHFSDFGLLFSFAYNSTRTDKSDKTINVFVRNTRFVSSNLGLGVLNPFIHLLHAAVLFADCTFENNTGESLIGAKSPKVVFQGSNTFRNNSALVGTGIQLFQNSYIYFEPHTHILFEGNHAGYVGGAIFTDSKPGDPCFYHVMDSPKTVTVDFVRNTADLAGSSIYGEVLKCKNFPSVFNTSNTEKNPSAIASDPERLCLCDGDKLKPDCSISRTYLTRAFPGQVFPVRLAVVGGKFDGVVAGAVRAYLLSPNNHAAIAHTSQTSVKPLCNNFYYAINSTAKSVVFELIPEQNFFREVTTGASVHVTVKVSLLGVSSGIFPVTCDWKLCV